MSKKITDLVSIVNNVLIKYKKNNNRIVINKDKAKVISSEIKDAIAKSNLISYVKFDPLNTDVFDKYFDNAVWTSNEGITYITVRIFKEGIADSIRVMQSNIVGINSSDIYEFYYSIEVENEEPMEEESTIVEESKPEVEESVKEEKEESIMETVSKEEVKEIKTESKVDSSFPFAISGTTISDPEPIMFGHAPRDNNDVNSSLDISIKDFISDWHKLDFSIQSFIRTIHSIDNIDTFTKLELNDKIDNIIKNIDNISMMSDFYDNIVVNIDKSDLFIIDTNEFAVVVNISITAVLDRDNEFVVKYNTHVKFNY